MQVSRLLYIIEALIEDYDQVSPKLKSLQSSLSNLASQSSEPAHAKAFHEARHELKLDLEKTRVDEFPPSCSRILDSLGGTTLFGQQLLSSVEKLFTATPFLASTAHDQLKSIVKELADLIANVRTTQAALSAIGVKEYEIPAGSFELGLLIPDSITQTNVDILQKEIGDWSQHVKYITETASGQEGTSLHYRCVDSGSFDIFISLDADGAHAILTVIGGLTLLYQKLMKAKEKKEELEKEGYPEKVIEAHDEHIGELETKELTKLQKQLLDNSPVDLERRNELNKGIKVSLSFIYDKVKAGVDIEVMSPTIDENGSEEEIEIDEKKLGYTLAELPLYIQHALSSTNAAIEHARNETQADKAITDDSDPPGEEAEEEIPPAE